MTKFIEFKDDSNRSIIINTAMIVRAAPSYDGATCIWLVDGRMQVVKMSYEALVSKLGIE